MQKIISLLNKEVYLGCTTIVVIVANNDKWMWLPNKLSGVGWTGRRGSMDPVHPTPCQCGPSNPDNTH